MNSELFLVLVKLPDQLPLSAFRLKAGATVVGRSSHADICLPDATVSRRHAQVEFSQTDVNVRDLKSRNGTFVEERAIQSASVRLGQRIRFGSVSLLLAQTPDGGLELGSQVETTDPRVSRRNCQPTPIPDCLSPAQRRVLDLLVQGDLEREVADKLGISQHTVHNHAREIYRAYRVHSRTELLLEAMPKPNSAGITVVGTFHSIS